MKENLLSIVIVTPDENISRLFVTKIKNNFFKVNFELSLFGEAKPAILHLENHKPTIVIFSHQIPGMKLSDFFKVLEKNCPHSLLLLLTSEIEGIRALENTSIIEVGTPILEWEKVLLLIEEEIPTELKFRYGLERRENALLKKLNKYALNFKNDELKEVSTVSFLPLEFESAVSHQTEVIKNKDMSENISSDEGKTFLVKTPTKKEEMITVFIILVLAVVFHLPWAKNGNYELISYPLDLILLASVIGFILRPFNQSKV